MKTLFGPITGLKPKQIASLERLYRRRVPPDAVVSPTLAREMSLLSFEIRRQIGLLIDRGGNIAFVIVGTPQGIVIPDTREYRSAPGRLRGLRCVHTHLSDEALTRDDLTDLSLLRLDLMAVLTMDLEGFPSKIHMAHILPAGDGGRLPYRVMDSIGVSDLDIGFRGLIRSIEEELQKGHPVQKTDTPAEQALLVSVFTGNRVAAKESMMELESLAQSAGIAVADTVLQQRREADPRFVLGKGKLTDLTILALQKGVTLLVFDQELSASQIRSITDTVEIKVIDRTQLILDIFAQRARTREGRLQVELAQLRYLRPRLVTKNTAMSRLTGGIGGRGPGETKLEINRRRVRERITRLEKEIERVREHRHQQRAQRSRQRVPIISIVGYTNAGKSTLLNTLTQSRVLAEERLFATLDPSSRRLRFPRDIEVIITDTVGFIRDLPQDLMIAFRATLEELENADLLLHVIDVASPARDEQIESVERILSDLELTHIPQIRVLNKMDKVSPQELEILKGTLGGVPVSAIERRSLMPLIEAMETHVEKLVDAYGDEGKESEDSRPDEVV
jgi:GTPase